MEAVIIQFRRNQRNKELNNVCNKNFKILKLKKRHHEFSQTASLILEVAMAALEVMATVRYSSRLINSGWAAFDAAEGRAFVIAYFLRNSCSLQ